MTIAVNVRLLLKDKLEGIGRFTYEIFKRITQSHPEHTFIFFFDRKFDPSFIFGSNVKPVILFPPSRHPVLWYIYFEHSISRALRKYKPDIFITSDGWLSIKTGVKTLQVLHDLHFDNHPEFLPYLTRKYYQYYFPKFIRRADRIVTVSEFCKKEIIQRYSLNENNIDVVYNSGREDYFPMLSGDAVQVRNQYTKGQPYFLFIGPVHPRKNLINSLEAFYQYKEKTGDKIKFVVTGSEMWSYFGGIQNRRNGVVAEDVIFTGYLSSEELYRLTAAAYCLVYVSFYEGFGMPMLEAMSCEVPVIASDRSAIPEVAGNAALFVNPSSIDSIENAMIEIRNLTDIKQQLISNGKTNIKRFSWDRSAALLWDSVLKTI